MTDQILCYNCFQNRPAESGACPHCGFDPAAARHYPLALPCGSILAGQYLVGRTLGQGGFGITYAARDLKAQTSVAIKEYFPEGLAVRTAGTTRVLSGGPQQEESFAYGKGKFLEEARTLARFNDHPGIVSVRSYFEENGTGYFAMERLDGVSLLQYLRDAGGSLPWEAACDLLLPVFDALDTVHAAGIIHRDISPDNIFICREGSVKLLDFGAARYVFGEKSQSLSVILKHGYAPVEQYSRRGRQGPWTDVYALAATLYRTVTGRLPPESIERRPVDGLIAPSSLCRIPPEGEKALIIGLEVEPADRWQSAGEFKRALLGEIESPLARAEREALARRRAEEEARKKEEESRRREQQMQAELQRQKRIRRSIGLAAGTLGVLVVGVLAYAGVLMWQDDQDRLFPARVLTWEEEGPVLLGRQASIDAVQDGYNAEGNASGNLQNNGSVTLTGVAGMGACSYMNDFDGALYYILYSEDLYRTDGERSALLLESEPQNWQDMCATPYGLLYKRGVIGQPEHTICLRSLNDDGTIGAEQELLTVEEISPLLYEEGSLYCTGSEGRPLRYDLATGEQQVLSEERTNPELAMDGWLYGCEPYLDGEREGETLWRMRVNGQGRTDLLTVDEGEFQAINGADGQLYLVLQKSDGSYLLRTDAEGYEPTVLYSAPQGAQLYFPQVMLLNGQPIVCLGQDSAAGRENLLIDAQGKAYRLDEML